MKMKNHKSSQTGKNAQSYIGKNTHSIYPHMFIEDFCMDFSISFSTINSHGDFFKITTEKLKKLLEEGNYLFLRYDLSKLLSKIMRDLIYKGKSSIETVLYYNDSNELVGIGFSPLNYITRVPLIRKELFIAKSFNGKLIHYNVKKNRLIKFNIREIGLTKNFFNKQLNKLSKLGTPNFSLTKKIPNFNFELYKRYEELKLLNCTKRIYWDGRNSTNRFVNQPYYLYRLTNYNILRLCIFKYLLWKINSSIEGIGYEYNFDGKVECKFDIDEKITYLKDSYEKYERQEINQEQLFETLRFND